MVMTAEFGLLGPLRVAGNTAREVRAGRLRTLLATLLLNANTTVSAAGLADAVWDESPPPQARATLQSYLMRLRRALGDDLCARVTTRPGGYQIDVAEGELDLRTFERHFQAGAASANAGDWARCAIQMRAALDLWRGSALADIPSDYLLRTEGARLDEMRLQALERRIQADLHCGRHDDVVAELRRLVTEFPLRERLWESLLLALYRSGQRAAALSAYRQVRRLLAGELAVEPGAELRRLHQQILTADSALLRPTQPARLRMPAPCTLPADIADFTGRAGQIMAIEGQLRNVTGTAVALTVLTGPAGTGKTVLGVHAAHRLRSAFPDGQLYLSLGGTRGNPLQQAEALAQLLGMLGLEPRAIPDGLGYRAAAYRRELADKRVPRAEPARHPALPVVRGCPRAPHYKERGREPDR